MAEIIPTTMEERIQRYAQARAEERYPALKNGRIPYSGWVETLIGPQRTAFRAGAAEMAEVYRLWERARTFQEISKMYRGINLAADEFMRLAERQYEQLDVLLSNSGGTK